MFRIPLGGRSKCFASPNRHPFFKMKNDITNTTDSEIGISNGAIWTRNDFKCMSQEFVPSVTHYQSRQINRKNYAITCNFWYVVSLTSGFRKIIRNSIKDCRNDWFWAMIAQCPVRYRGVPSVTRWRTLSVQLYL